MGHDTRLFLAESQILAVETLVGDLLPKEETTGLLWLALSALERASVGREEGDPGFTQMF